MVTHLEEWTNHASIKAWLSAVEDWVLSHTHTMPNNLGPATIHPVACLTMSQEVYFWLETSSVLGMT